MEWNNWNDKMKITVTGYVRRYVMTTVIYGYLEWDNKKVLKFHVNNSSYFEIRTALF